MYTDPNWDKFHNSDTNRNIIFGYARHVASVVCVCVWCAGDGDRGDRSTEEAGGGPGGHTQGRVGEELPAQAHLPR